MNDETAAPRRSVGSLLLVVLTLVGSAVGVFLYYYLQGKPPGVGTAGFDISQTTANPAATPTTPPSEAQTSLTMINVGTPPATRLGSPGGPSGGAPEPAPAPADQRLHEKEFLRQYGPTLAQYQGRLTEITNRYYKKSPVVRDVDKTFGGMPRYMALRQRYEKDGDPFQFSRDALALSEVRAEIGRRMADPEVWKVTINMISETLKKQPPPAPIYNEAKKFMSRDAAMENYLEGDVTVNVQKNMNTVVGAMLSSGVDMAPLNKVVGDVAPQHAKPNAP